MKDIRSGPTLEGSINAELLNEVVLIRRLLMLLVVLCLLAFLARIVLAIFYSKSRSKIVDEWYSMLDHGEAERVVAQTQKRLLRYPDDPYARWALAKALRKRGDLWRALAEARRTQELKPDWQEEYTTPFILETEKELARSGAKAREGESGETPPTQQPPGKPQGG